MQILNTGHTFINRLLNLQKQAISRLLKYNLIRL